VFLSANAPKQIMIPTLVELSSAMMFIPGGLLSILGLDAKEALLKGLENNRAPYNGTR
jgi:hypothetical protein